MAQGQFTKEEAIHVEDTLQEVMDGLSKTKKAEYIGHFNDLFLFIKAAKDAAPSEKSNDQVE